MKPFFVVPAALCLMIISSCGSGDHAQPQANNTKTPQELIANSWQVKDISGGLAAQMPDSVKQIIMKSGIVLHSDGKFEMTNGVTPMKGNFSLTPDGKRIMYTTDGGVTGTDSLAALTADQLVVVDTSGTRIEYAPAK